MDTERQKLLDAGEQLKAQIDTVGALIDEWLNGTLHTINPQAQKLTGDISGLLSVSDDKGAFLIDCELNDVVILADAYHAAFIDLRAAAKTSSRQKDQGLED